MAAELIAVSSYLLRILFSGSSTYAAGAIENGTRAFACLV
jgi:hypothetical protein